jgi:hypothetical protein
MLIHPRVTYRCKGCVNGCLFSLKITAFSWNICKFDNIDINIKQESNNSHKKSSFSKDIKQQLKQKYEELFFDKLKSTKENSKIHIYSKIKTEYEMNNYILNINYEDRKLLCKMRVSDHFLEI